MKITIAKALKLKNKLAGETKDLANKMKSNNSYNVNNKPNYDSREMLAKFEESYGNLINLKTAIQVANTAIVNKIIRMGKLKSVITQICSMPCNKGENESGYSNEKTIYDCTIGEVEKDNIVKKYQEEIEKLQDEIDLLNATTEIEI